MNWSAYSVICKISPEFISFIRTNDKQMKRIGLNRLFLHASSLRLMHPKTEETVTFNAPYDEQLTQAVNTLEKV